MTAVYVAPDFTGALDVAGQLAAVPAEGTVKGMFLQGVGDQARAASGHALGRGRWVAFKDYPLREWLDLMLEAAPLVHARVPLREALRRLGRGAFGVLRESTVGRVILNMAGPHLGTAIHAVPAVYKLSGSLASAEVVASAEDAAEVQLRGVWDFPDAFQVGVFEGVMAAFGRAGAVRVRSLSRCDVDLELVWR